MASLWKHPKSQFWTACFTDDNGRQLKRSTKLTDRNKATLMAQKFEAAYRMKLTEAQARKVVSDIFEQIHGEQLYHATVRKFLADWMTNKKSETSPGTHKRYQNAVDKLLDFLGDRADRDIAYVHKRDLAALRDKTAAELSVSTANTDLKILRVAFHQAVIDGLRLDNPGAAVRTLEERKSSDAPERRPFTEKELKTLFAVAEGEWSGLILGGLYTGQRLGDLASLTGRRIDLQEELLTFRSQKTGRDMVIPIGGKRVYVVEHHHQALEAWAEIRQCLDFSPTLLSLDRHNDTRPAFWRYMAGQGLVTDNHYCNPELALELLNTESAKYNYQNPASILQAIENLRHDEHIDAAVRLNIISRAFIIAFDQIEVTQRDIDGNFRERGDHMYVLPRLGDDDVLNRIDADNSLETEWLYEKLEMIDEIAPLDGDPDWKEPGFILDIDLDYFRTPKAVAPDDPMVFHAMISASQAITIALEPYCVRGAQLGAPQTANQLLAAVKAHIAAAQAAVE